ncbi:glycosyltransferase family 39 protein [Methanobrevibacter sp.]|uniref:glycosyltransferase family 39 protein n=1 Tax=Methanobrevibacter sp. TaxID=66852 RepID=UPI00386D99F2
MSGGIFYPDKALYLINALNYSGLDYYCIANPKDIFYSPIISFLTSLLFKMGIVDQLAISLVSSFFALFGFLGLYLLLRFRFNSILSLMGVVIYGSTSELLINLSSGLLDIPSVSISILVLLFGIIAIDEDSKYFIITFLMLVIGFFTRYTVGFMLPVLILYYIMKRNFIENIDCIIDDKSFFKAKINNYFKSSEFKYLFLSIILAIILFAVICKYLILDYGGDLTFIHQSVSTIKNSNYGVGGGIDVVYDKLFYLKNFSSIFFSESRCLDRVFSCLIYGIIGFGVIFRLNYFIRYYSKITEPIKEWKTKNFRILLISLLVIMAISTFISFKVFSSHILTNIFFLLATAIFYSLINEFNINKNEQALNLLFLSYLMINLIFISIYQTKTLRYALQFMPPLIYILIYCLEGILDYLNCPKEFNVNLNENIFNEKQYSGYKVAIPIVLIIILVISSFSFIAGDEISGSDNDLVDVTDFIIQSDSDYHQKAFGSNYRDSRIIRWYLQVNVTFDDDYNFSDLKTPSYIISDKTLSLDNYNEIYNKGQYHVYYLK